MIYLISLWVKDPAQKLRRLRRLMEINYFCKMTRRLRLNSKEVKRRRRRDGTKRSTTRQTLKVKRMYIWTMDHMEVNAVMTLGNRQNWINIRIGRYAIKEKLKSSLKKWSIWWNVDLIFWCMDMALNVML